MFLNSWMAFGSLAGSIPIIIHLLNKQKFKRLYWAAMHWLWASNKKASRRIRVEQLILLAIRTLLLILLALAMARPALQQAGLLGGRQTTYRVVMIDNSLSMGRIVEGQPLFSRALEVARPLIHDLNESDELDVVFFNNGFDLLTPNPQMDKKNQVLPLLDNAQTGPGGTNVPRAIAEACRLMRDRGQDAVRREIVVITDQTRAGWETGDTGGKLKKLDTTEEQAIQDAFQHDDRKPRIWVLRLPSTGAIDDLGVTKFDLAEKVAVAGVETPMTVTVRNYSGTEASDVVVHFYTRTEAPPGQKDAPVWVSIGTDKIPSVNGNGTSDLTFRHTFKKAGSYGLKVELEKRPNDVLPANDSAYLALEVEEQVKVLCVDGQPRSQAMASEMDFLRIALAPPINAEESKAKMPLAPEVIDSRNFQKADLSKYRLVILGNVNALPPERLAGLEEYVRKGGALWIWVGDYIVNGTDFNDRWKKLLPAQLSEHWEGDLDPDGPNVKVSDTHSDHPALASIRKMDGLPLSGLKTFRRFRLTPITQGEGKDTVQTILAYENGEPAGVEFRLELGRVMLMGTTADKDWNNWPRQPVFLPLINTLAMHLIQPAYTSRNRLVGEALLYQIPIERISEFNDKQLELLEPDDKVNSMLKSDDKPVRTSAPTRLAGIYRARLEGATEPFLHMAVNSPVEESVLNSISDAEIKAYLPDPKGAPPAERLFEANVTQNDLELHSDLSAMETSMREYTKSKELWRGLILAVVLLLFLESFLAMRFGNYNR